MKNKVTKILVLLLILGLIMVKICNVGVEASDTLEALLNEAGNEITSEDGSTSGLPQGNNALNDALTNQPTSGTNTNTNTNKNNTSLPKTGTNENIIIGLMVICTLTGIYAFKKVKDYNM